MNAISYDIITSHTEHFGGENGAGDGAGGIL